MPAAPDRPGPAKTRPQSPAPSATTLIWGIRVLWGEAVAIGLLVIFLLYADFTEPAGSAGGALAVTLYAAVEATLLGGLAWALSRRKVWARGPAIVLQLLFLPIGYSMATNGLGWLGLVLIVVGVCGAATLLAPATRAALGMR
jgi:hypothetical protein